MNTSPLHRTPRRRWLYAARSGAALSAAMLVVSISGALGAGAEPLVAGAAATPGLTMSVASGNSATSFSLDLAAPNNACPGDSATDGYRWHGYLVAASVDVATLRFDASGPVDTPKTAFPLLTATGGSPLVNKLLGTEPKGQIIGTQTMSFAQFPAKTIAAGAYKIGYACTLAGATERYWQLDFTVTTDATNGGPSQFTFAVTTPVATTTTTTVAAATTTTTVAGATTTTVKSATTTTAATTTTTTAATTTTTSGSTTTTALASGGPTSTIASSFSPTGFNSGSSGSGSGSGSTIPVTGPSHTVRIVFWALLLLAFGRMAVLLARPIRVLPPGAR